MESFQSHTLSVALLYTTPQICLVQLVGEPFNQGSNTPPI